MENNKYKKNLKDINFYNHIEKLILKDEYLKHFNINEIKVEEVEIIQEERRLKWLNEKIYKLKEDLIYNNLNTEYLQDLNLSNISYYKTYFEIFKNFDSEDYSNLILLRMNFLNNIIEEAKDKEKKLNGSKIANDLNENQKFNGDFLSKKSILMNENDEFFVDAEKQRLFNQIFSTLSSLLSVILNYDVKVSERCKLKEQIISCMMNNLNTQSEKVYFHSIYAMKEIEKNLFLLINIFQKNLLPTSIINLIESKEYNNIHNNSKLSEFKSDDYLNFISEILEKLLSVTARLNSFTSFLKILYILKENKIALKNFDYLVDNILNPKVRSFIKPFDEKYFIEEKKITLNDYFCNAEILKTNILLDEKFIFFQSLVIREKEDLFINLFNIDKELKTDKINQNKILDFKSFNINEYLFESVRLNITENLKKVVNENDEGYNEMFENSKKIANDEVKIKTILPHNCDYIFILIKQKNIESIKLLKIFKENLSLVNEIKIDYLNSFEIINIFTTRDCFYIFKKQITDEDKQFNEEKLDIFDSDSKEKTFIYEFEKLDFSTNRENVSEDFSKHSLVIDYSKLYFNEKDNGLSANKPANHNIIRNFIEFCKEDLENKYYSLSYLNNTIIFFKKAKNVQKFFKIDLNSLFKGMPLDRDQIQIYNKLANSQFYCEMVMNKEKNLENNFNLFYDINTNLVFGINSFEKTKNKENNMEMYKHDEAIIKYRIYYNPYSFPAVDGSVHEVLNNNIINEKRKILDSFLEEEENPNIKSKASFNINELFKGINLDLVKTNSTDFMNIDCSIEIMKAKFEKFSKNDVNKKVGNEDNLRIINKDENQQENSNDLEYKNIVKDYNNYKNLSNLFIKNTDDKLESFYSNENYQSKKNLKFIIDNEIASEVYFEIAFRSLSKYIINNSNIISTLKNVKHINKEVYDDFFKMSYPKFVYHFGKNMSAELFNILWEKNFCKLNLKIDENKEINYMNIFSSDTEGDIILLDLILVENLFKNFKHLKMGYFENYFDVKYLKEFCLLLIKILTFKLNENYEINKMNMIIPDKNSSLNNKIEKTEIEILNQVTKILVLVINNVKNHSFVFNIKRLDDLARLLVEKIHLQKINFCDINSYLFYFLSLFLNTSEISLDKKHEIIDFILKSEISFIRNIHSSFNNKIKLDLHIKNKYFEKTFNNVIHFLIKDFSRGENIKNLNSKDSKEMKILSILNENLIQLISVLKTTNKDLLENTIFKLYIKNFSLILNSNFIIFNLIFRLFNYTL